MLHRWLHAVLRELTALLSLLFSLSHTHAHKWKARVIPYELSPFLQILSLKTDQSFAVNVRVTSFFCSWPFGIGVHHKWNNHPLCICFCQLIGGQEVTLSTLVWARLMSLSKSRTGVIRSITKCLCWWRAAEQEPPSLLTKGLNTDWNGWWLSENTLYQMVVCMPTTGRTGGEKHCTLLDRDKSMCNNRV